jgi:uncharacterized membrane protein
MKFVRSRVRMAILLATTTVASAGSGWVTASQAAADPSGLPSIACQFTEPFLDAVISTEGLVIRNADDRYVAYQYQSGDVANSQEQTYRFQRRNKRVTLSIQRKPGGDGMSDRVFALTGVLDGQVGGCIEHPAGMVPRLVRRVAEDDELKIRKNPRARAAVVGQAYNDGWIFAVPSTDNWWRVSVQNPARGESGPVGSVAGYAKRAFITQRPTARF